MNTMNPLAVYATTDKEKFPSFNGNEERPNTTFFADFMVCDLCYRGNEKKRLDAIKDTFNRAFEGWKDNYKYLTELTMMLNHLLWYYYEKEGEESKTAHLYNDLWGKCENYVRDNLKDEEAEYYYRISD